MDTQVLIDLFEAKYLGPTGEPKCPKCSNSLQNNYVQERLNDNTIEWVDSSVMLCASCKHTWVPLEAMLLKEYKKEVFKNKNSLANNLCPDHRGKQPKDCLMCLLEKEQKNTEKIEKAIKILVLDSEMNPINSENAMTAYGSLLWAINKDTIVDGETLFDRLIQQLKEAHIAMLKLTEQEYEAVLKKVKLPS